MSKPKSIKAIIEEAQQPSTEPSEREQHNAFVQAILLGWKGIKYDPAAPPDLEDTVWGYLNTAAKWWRGKMDNAEVAAPVGATPELIVAFYAWFRRTFPNITPPSKRETIVEQWVSFKLDGLPKAQRGHGTSGAPTQGMELERRDSPDYQPMTLTDYLERSDPDRAEVARARAEAYERRLEMAASRRRVGQ